MSLDTLNGNDIAKLLLSWNSKEFQENASKLSLEQLALTVSWLNENHDEAREKLEALFSATSEDKALEVFAQSISSEQFLQILSFCDLHNQRSKLPLLFIALPVEIFKNILLNASDLQLNILKQESVTEPLQLHLLHLQHELSGQLQNLNTSIAAIEKEIESINRSAIERAKIEALFQTIRETFLNGQKILNMIDRGLSVVWNTGRGDLIEKFSALKEKNQRCLHTVIGHPREASILPSGLYKYLEDNLYAIYAGSNDNQTFFDDSDPAIEALSYFAIWHLEDYAELGLIDTNVPLELDSSKYSEQERLQYRGKLFNVAKSKLEEIGLVTLHDLKRAWIFSKDMLKEYIKAKSP